MLTTLSCWMSDPFCYLYRKEERHETQVSLDEIKKIAGKAQQDGARNREELLAWMSNKRHKQMQEYKRHLDELREREIHPFRPAQENLDQVFCLMILSS